MDENGGPGMIGALQGDEMADAERKVVRAYSVLAIDAFDRMPGNVNCQGDNVHRIDCDRRISEDNNV